MRRLALIWLFAAFPVAATCQAAPRPDLLDMAPGCRILVHAPHGAWVSSGKEGGGSGGMMVDHPPRGTKKPYVNPFYLPFICHEADPEELTIGRPVRFDNAAQQWVRDMQKFFDYQGVPIDAKWREDQLRAVRFYELRAVNSYGFAYTHDDVVGDEAARRRQLNYCLFRAAQAICGDTEVGNLNDIRRNRKNDLTSYALQILRSVEFLDDAPAPSERPSSSPSVR